MNTFQNISEEKIIYRGDYYFLVYDSYPVSPGHILIISQDIKSDFFELSDVEKIELPLMIDKAKEIIESSYSPNGFNIGMNCRKAAGQTVMQFHCHVIPRYQGDMDDPRGGIRHCIKGKGYY
ncbi:HIT family protein [Flavobacteriaceae bacterium KMM 6898]|nr:HIT family protein [Flavobacteriaceae bacterium KMM 6898]